MQIKVFLNPSKRKYIISPDKEKDYIQNSKSILKNFTRDLNLGLLIYLVTRIIGFLILFGGIAIAITLFVYKHYIYIWSGFVFSLFSIFFFINKTTIYTHNLRILKYYEEDLNKFYRIRKKIENGESEKNWKMVSYEFTPIWEGIEEEEVIKVLAQEDSFENYGNYYSGDEKIVTSEDDSGFKANFDYSEKGGGFIGKKDYLFKTNDNNGDVEKIFNKI